MPFHDANGAQIQVHVPENNQAIEGKRKQSQIDDASDSKVALENLYHKHCINCIIAQEVGILIIIGNSTKLWKFRVIKYTANSNILN